MNYSVKKIKSWLIISLFFFALAPDVMAQGRGVWKGAPISFTKTAGTDWTKAANQDRITDSVWITRQNQNGIYNIKVSGAYGNTEPKGTKWAYGTTATKNLKFNNWVDAHGYYPPGMVNQNMVMLILKDSLQIDIKFTAWSQGGSGGGFAYTRSTDCRTWNTVSRASCDSFISPSKRHIWRKSGTYMDTLVNSQKCDSILTVKLYIYDQQNGEAYLTGCGSVISPFNKVVITKTGTYYDTLLKGTVCGRDSFLEVVAWINPIPTSSMTVVSCDSFVSPSKKYVWKTSGTYSDFLRSTGPCDTTVTINLTVNSSKSTKIKRVACDSFLSVTNKVYRISGNYHDTLQTMQGCDSVIDLDLTINKSAQNTSLSPWTCRASYTSPSGRYVWGKSGMYTDTLRSSIGCDSVLEINLSLVLMETYETVNSCEPWTSPSKKYVYNKTGRYYDTLLTKGMCDSLIIIDFTKFEKTYGTKKVTAAINSYSSPSGKYVWTTSGMFNDTIKNKVGCDSVITVDLIVKNISLDVTKNGSLLTAVATGVNYQWLDCDIAYKKIPGATKQTYEATESGSYAVELSNVWNSDRSDCISVRLGVKDVKNPYAIKVYPNPNNGHFTLDLGTAVSDVNAVQVYNATGEKLYESHEISKLMNVDFLNQISAGMYVVRVIGNNFSYSTSVVVQ